MFFAIFIWNIRHPKTSKSKTSRGQKQTKDYDVEDDYYSIDYPDKENPKRAKSKTTRGQKPIEDDEYEYDYPDTKSPKRVISETPRGQKPTSKRSNMQAKCKNKRTRQRPQMECDVDMDCYRGQYCATDENLCMDVGCQEFDDECERNGGNFRKTL